MSSLRLMAESLDAEEQLDSVMGIAMEIERVLAHRPLVAATIAVGIVVSRLYERRARLEKDAGRFPLTFQPEEDLSK